MALVLYELGGARDLRYSLFSWRTRMALAHKGLDAELRPVQISDKAAIAFSSQEKVPILVDGDKVIPDSWRIAGHLEAAYPDRPSLFGGETGHALAGFINAWADRQVIPRLFQLYVVDVVACVGDADARHLRQSTEKYFKSTPEDLAKDRDRDLVAFRRLLEPARASLRSQAFLSGARPGYADYIVFSPLQWARIVSRHEVLEPADPLVGWRERMLDLHGGLARAASTRAALGI